jgi:hypothetical protein
MKHRDIIFKENIDIKRVLSRGSMPYYTKIKQKVLENKKKISMFIGMMFILNLHPVYNCNKKKIIINRYVGIFRS